MRARETKERQTYEQTTDKTNRQAERERERVRVSGRRGEDEKG